MPLSKIDTRTLKLKLMAIACLGLFSCAMQKPKAINEGIAGYIYEVTGNQMPMKGKLQSNGKGITREVWIYKATSMQQVQGQSPLFTQIRTTLAAKVKSDNTGRYQATLPAGRYSVFVKEGNQFFAAETEDNGILNLAEVITGKVTNKNVTVNIGAAY